MVRRSFSSLRGVSLSRALSLLSVLILSVPTLSVPGLAVNQFLSPTLYPTGVQLGSFNPQQTIGDFNGDGKLDVLLISSSFGTTNISVLPGKGDGSFGTPILTNVAASLSLIKNQPLAVGDFNGDGKLDVAVLAGSVQKIGLLLGNGDGTFTYQLTSNTFSAPISSLATADFNGDGKADIVVGGFTSAGLVASVQVLLANSDGTFQAKTAKTFQLPASSTQTALTLIPGIFKLGGQTDVVVGDSLGTNIFRLSGNGDGTFQSPKTVALGLGSAPGLIAGDFNGDGKLDLAAQGNLLLGNGDGTFQAPKSTPVNFVPYIASDFNGDGKMDAYGSGCLSLGTSAGSFQTPHCIAAGGVTIYLNTGAVAVTLTSSANPSKVGQAVTFQSAISPTLRGVIGTPTGTVTFKDGSTVLGTGKIKVGGIASFSTSTLAKGSHTITATYSGDGNFIPKSSLALTQVVQ